MVWVMGSVFVSMSFAQEEQGLFDAEDARALLEQMTPEERVGQLFLVSVEGAELEANSDIEKLILTSRIGGVILEAENDNFSDSATSAQDLGRMVNSLQELSLLGRSSRIAAGSESEEINPELDQSEELTVTLNMPLPLFIGSTHGGGSHAQILSNLTEVPSQLAIGATWDPEMAKTTGEIIGSELNALGFNLMLNPSLNVVSAPELLRDVHSAGLIDSFGGNPYWVGEFGAAYVAGVKSGSDGKLLVVGGNFPGSGGSDRPLNSEVATVRTSLIELQQGDLAPFLKVANRAVMTDTIDGFMTAHLRYQGFQGNIDNSSIPLSFDAQAIETLLQIEPLADWRSAGGLLVSGDLGAPAIRRFYATEEDPFPHRRVARDSLLAGNDLLYVGDFAADSSLTSEFDNVADTLDWFTDEYASNSTFRARVDEAVVRILQAKLNLYDGDFSLGSVLIDEVSVAGEIGIAKNQIDMLALESIAQLAPRPSDNPEPLPRTPNREDNIVIFTDVHELSACSTCDNVNRPGVEALKNRMLQLYGPEASNQVAEEQISSFSFDDLAEYINAETPILAPTPAPITNTSVISEPVIYPTEFLVQDALQNAEWVVFLAQGVRGDISSSSALNQLLAERPDMLSGRVVPVFSMGYPIDLDATDTSQITAYFGLFSPGESFVDAAARVIFREQPARGASPISISSVRYDLDQVTSPQPLQVIDLMIEEDENGADNILPANSPGDTLRLRTGIITDYNGNAVPDGTLVQFTQEDRVQGFFSVIAEVFTIDGRASFDYVLEDRPGQFRLRAQSGEARTSAEVDIAIAENASAQIEVITPTPLPTFTPTPSPIPTETTTPTPNPTITPAPTLVPQPPNTEPQINITLTEMQTIGSLILGLFGVGWIGNLTRSEKHPLSGRLRKILWGLLFALVGYIWFFTEMPGAEFLPDWGVWRWMFVAVVCGLPGVGLAWLFNQVFEAE